MPAIAASALVLGACLLGMSLGALTLYAMAIEDLTS
jgi:hypothetical protein